MPVQQINVKNSCDIEPGDWGLVPYAREESQNVRLGSSSSQSCSSGDICRICHCESDVQNPLLAPCYCSGSLKFVHQTCLQQWLTASETRSCELCKFPFIMHTKIKPFNEWRRLEMSGVERRRLCCAVLFHCVAALCVIWSLFVLIDRAAEEVQRGLIAWPFWTKLVVVAVGFTGGAVFMYIQCRQYLHLCNRWRAHNRILLIQNAPEKIHIVPPSPIVTRNVLRHPLPSALSNPPRSTLDHIANIENNPQNYELGHTPNWSLEEVNNVEEFELNSASVHSSKLDTSVYIPENTFMAPELRRTEQINSSVFLENKDILGDDKNIKQQSPKIQHRHSTVLTSDTDSKLDGTRRYSDTKLLQSFHLPSNFNITKFLGAGVNDNFNSSKSESPFNFSYNQAQKEVFVKNTYDTSHTETPSASLIQPLSSSYGHTQSAVTGDRPVCNQENTTINISKIIFESSTSFDPLELKIQELLELDIETSRKKSVLSLNMKDSRNGYEKNKSLFKSLPNLLSASSENLLP